jgi:hypothetical protein
MIITLPTYGYDHHGHQSHYHTPLYIKRLAKNYSTEYHKERKHKNIDKIYDLKRFDKKLRTPKTFILGMGSRFIYWVMSFFYSEYTWVLEKKPEK